MNARLSNRFAPAVEALEVREVPAIYMHSSITDGSLYSTPIYMQPADTAVVRTADVSPQATAPVHLS